MRILIYGAGNLILSDEGFGVHFVRHLERYYQIPENVELYDGGTRRSSLAVLDAARIGDGPVARLLLEHHVPVSFHGSFRPAVGRAPGW